MNMRHRLGWVWLWMLCIGVTVAEPEPRNTAWVDTIWRDHLIQRGALFSQQPVLQEAFYRDALKVDSRSVEAVEALARRFQTNEESALAAAAVTYGRVLSPDRPAWSEIWAWAWPRVEQGASGPTNAVTDARYKAGLDAMLAQVKSNQLMQAELEVRNLMREMPRDPRLMENIATFARLSGQEALAAMAFGFLHALDPDQESGARSLADQLQKVGLSAGKGKSP